jgi:lambda family phage tail tape measure protein
MDDNVLASQGDDLAATADRLNASTSSLTSSANSFSRAMSTAFARGITDGKSFDDTLKSLALRLSSLTVSAALRPVTNGIAGGLTQLLGGLFSGSGVGPANPGASLAAAMGAIKPFAAGGVIGTPTYFPLSSGGTGLAGEAGPEAIMPLARGADGRLGIASSAGSGGSVTINIATPDAGSFRRSETYLAGQIARAVARGQRSL